MGTSAAPFPMCAGTEDEMPPDVYRYQHRTAVERKVSISVREQIREGQDVRSKSKDREGVWFNSLDRRLVFGTCVIFTENV